MEIGCGSNPMVTICGWVGGPRGERIWNATVVFRPRFNQSGAARFGLADGGGEFQIDGLEPGPYTVIVTHRFYEIHSFDYDVSQDESIEITLMPDLTVPRTY